MAPLSPDTRPPPARIRSRFRVAGIVIATVLVFVLTGSYPSFERRLIDGVIDNATEAPFYVLPDPVPAGSPGELVRKQRIFGAPTGAEAWRILYHSTDVHGADIIVSGVVLSPVGPAPSGGRTVVSWGHPTTGAAQRCAPSLNVEPPSLMGIVDPFGIEGLGDLLAAGYVVAATDYPGMGVAGPDSYLIGTTEGNSLLDAARAAGHIPEAAANQRLLLWGHSQGGHAVLFAAQAARAYAPELDLIGAAVAAPATELGALLKADIGDVAGVTIGSYAFSAYASVYGPTTPGATLDTILTPAGVAATPSMYALCLLSQTSQLHAIATPLIGKYLAADPTSVEPWASLLAANTPAATALPVPLFVAQGDADTLVKPADTAAFARQQCAAGASVSYLAIRNTGHGLVALRALPELLTWFAAVNTDRPVPSTCATA